MSISVTCPDCATQLRVSEALAGTVVKCRGCGAMLKVPAALSPEEQAALERYQNKVNAELFGDVNLSTPEQVAVKAGKPAKVEVARCAKCKHAIDPDLDVCPVCGHNQLKGLHAPVHAARKFKRSLGTDIGSLRSDVRSSLRATMMEFQGVKSRTLVMFSAVAIVLGLSPLLGLAFPVIANTTQYLPFVGLFIGVAGGVVFYFTGDTRAAMLGMSGTVAAVTLSVMLIYPHIFPPQNKFLQQLEQAKSQPAAPPTPAAERGTTTVNLK